MENDKVIENSFRGAEGLINRPPASAGSGIAGSTGQVRESIVCLFEGVATANRDKVAAVCGNVRLTYGELNSQANYVAESLRALGVRADSFVAI
jgi:non-ribosomal peptide synthetase component F